MNREIETYSNKEEKGIFYNHQLSPEYELEMKEIEIGEYQFENEKLLDRVKELSHQNEALQMDILRSSTYSLINVWNQTQEVNSLLFSVQVLQSKLKKHSFGAGVIANDDQRSCFYTGLPSYKLFEGKELEPLLTSKIAKNTSLIDEFFLTLVKLRFGVPMDDIAYRMDISTCHASQPLE